MKEHRTAIKTLRAQVGQGVNKPPHGMAAILRQRQYCGSLPSPSGARARLICRACAKPKTSARTGSSSWSRFRAACGAGGVALALQLGIPGLTPPALASQQGGSSDYVVLERRKIESILEKEFAAK